MNAHSLAALDCFLIADDLTGAADAAVHFAAQGRRTSVSVAECAETSGATVVAVSTESRDLRGDAAYARLAASASQLDGRPAQILFKKIDSTLRGSVGAEIAAALDLFGCDAAVVSPAFPALGRVVERGALRVDREDFDPLDVAELLRSQGLERCTAVPAGAIENAISSGARAVCLDATCDRDLDRIAEEALVMDLRILWAGSGGLAAALARTLPIETASPRPRGATGPVLFCIGSTNAATVRQQAALAALRSVRTLSWEYATRDLIFDALGRGEHVCLQVPRGEAYPERVHELITGAPAAALLLSGGDTASLVARTVGTLSIELREEIAPGIPFGLIEGGDFDGTGVATKSGGFGSEDALVRIADYFLCPNHQ